MALSRRWAGKAYGTNLGNLFLTFEGDGDETNLEGVLRFNEPGYGVKIYRINGQFDGTLCFHGELLHPADLGDSQFTAKATLNPRGELEGDWETNNGLAGTFILFPHDRPRESNASEGMPVQLHTARHQLSAVEIDRDQVEHLARKIQQVFNTGRVIVTVVAGVEQSRFLEDFEALSFETERAEVVKLFVQEPEVSGINKVISIELGPQLNEIMTQGADEAWVLGKLEELKRYLKKYERNYTTHFRRIGFGFNQLLLVGAIVYLPSIENLLNRAIFLGGTCLIALVVNWLHQKYLPFASIYLSGSHERLAKRISLAMWSWLIAVSAALVAALLAAFLQGWWPTLFGQSK